MENKEQWVSKFGFILAAAGSAIGLGAIWKFPYIAGTSGGGAFFLIFILFTVLVGLPLLLAEFIIGRSTQKEAVSAYKTIAPGSMWHLVGRLGVVTCFILLSFYSVVGGWVLSYLFRSATGQLTGLGDEAYGGIFGGVISSPIESVLAQLAFMLLVIFVVAKGVSSGIEKASKYMMPALFVLFLILIVRSLTLDGAAEGISFLLMPDFSAVTADTILFAMGQSFFALSVGVSVMVTYSSYLSKKESLPLSATSIVGMNIFISLLAGLAIFPAVFTFGFEPGEGPALLFIVLPAVFDQMAFGAFFLTMFLVLFLFATLTSAFSMLEIIVASITKGETSRRKKNAWIAGILVFVVGIPSALSFGIWSEVLIFNLSIFDAADYLVSNILMPLGALLIAIFAPLKIKKDVLINEISSGTSNGKKWFAVWLLLIRYVAPIAIIIVFLNVLGVF
ncbi:sodium-dependent transporter [Bacillus sp. FJAT-45350]|uniref:sodium-dependent transporter n=1 Tax=Bacillus sp. FJAT-45350 TaxID=2011014 RepID=UPI000BB6F3D3|nr:sodium-dependent transporter [Bacillus sp. FJAT-45350]